jgi:hypothetical protein
MMCVQRRTGWGGRTAASYWLMGFVSAAMGILIEKPYRRTELALYVLPKAAVSMLTLVQCPRVPLGEYLLFSSAMAIIMVFGSIISY